MEARISPPSHAAILAAITEAMNTVPHDGGQAIRVDELKAATGWGVHRCREAIKKLLAEGQMELIHVRRLAMDGSQRVVPAYRLKASVGR